MTLVTHHLVITQSQYDSRQGVKDRGHKSLNKQSGSGPKGKFVIYTMPRFIWCALIGCWHPVILGKTKRAPCWANEKFSICSRLILWAVACYIGSRNVQKFLGTSDGSMRVCWSVMTKQEQRKHRREHRDQAAPPQGRRSRRGDASNPSCGQVRGQQLLLEGEVVHCQVISQVWAGGEIEEMDRL